MSESKRDSQREDSLELDGGKAKRGGGPKRGRRKSMGKVVSRILSTIK